MRALLKSSWISGVGMTIQLKCWGQSDVGLVREKNEDSFLATEEKKVFAVADGMGGHKGGAIASKLALDTFLEVLDAGFYDDADNDFNTLGMDTTKIELEHRRTREIPVSAAHGDLLKKQMLSEQAVREACIRVFERSKAEPDLKGMGTTLTALYFDDEHLQLVHVGDSRAYRLRQSKLERLTTDHSWVSEQISAGTMSEDEAKESEFKHVITRSIGYERFVEVDASLLQIENEDVYLLCSDGLSNYVEDLELENIMNNTEAESLCEVLIDLAKSRGGDDNISVVVAKASEV